jgi:hypothetical protein
MAFMKLAMDQKEFQGRVVNPIRFTGADMIKLLGLRKGGFHYDEINDWCKRMVATTIMSESSVFLADRRQYVSDTFHVFDRVVLVGEEVGKSVKSEFYQVYLSEWQLNNLNHGYLLPLDFNAYVQLRRDISKALFGHLSVWFYASRGQDIEKKYRDLCELLSVRAYPHVSKAKAVLAPSLDELVSIRYLSGWELVRAAANGDLKLTLSPGQRLLSLPSLSAIVNRDGATAFESKLPNWVGILVQRGVSDKKARQLALDIADDQPVLDQIEYAEHLIQQDQRGRGKIANPAGFIVWAIENNLKVPADFETQLKKSVRAVQDHSSRDEHARRLELRLAYDEYCEKEVGKRIAAEFPGEQLDQALVEHLKIIRREQADWFGRVNETIRREVAMTRLRATVRSRLSLSSFEEWLSRHAQVSLF